ncbi:excalibur calcium-binding domain-containing protein [Candidatus Woesearchaeota archaeon]|mgnify:CR=1 FL=1|nr:excalibur calcium-binding domain-containing protein [Candidatus Woesearchaeota archaeon]MBT5342908.1 excalibur calcium-binding domain-containing protein [Candidatus Woesearchaeota archaeon]
MVFSTLMTLIYAKMFFVVILAFLFFYNLVTDKKKHWGYFFTIMLFVFLIDTYEDELYEDMMYDQSSGDQYTALETEQYKEKYGADYDGSKDPNNIYDCADFNTHAEAQKVFERDGGPSIDVHHLDRDGDGIACETLP